MENQFKNLLSPFKIGNLTVKNRFCVAPMGQTRGYNGHGEWNEEGIEYFNLRAKGGWGAIFTGAMTTDMQVDPFAPEPPASPLLSPANFMRTSLHMNERIHTYDARIFAQITMGLGRNYGNPSPSELPSFINPGAMTKELTKEEIKSKIDAMVQAAALMKASGFDGVEVHSIHWGYLLDEFAMEFMNHRTDEYGGTLENRLRAAREIVEGIKQVCGSDYPVTMRLGLKTFIKGFYQASLDGSEEVGRSLEEGIEIAKLLESYGYDALNVDTGIYDSFYYAAPPCYMERGFMLPLAEAAKKAVNIPILCGGGRLDDPYLLEQAIADGKIDAVSLGRASLADPDFPKKVEMGTVERIRPCIVCNNGCLGRALSGGETACAVNPIAMRENSYSISAAIRPKKIAVVGGGVAGMEFARTAAMRGHKVEVYEKNSELGGNLLTAGAHTFKNEINKLNEWYKRELKEMAIPVHLNTEIDADKLKAMDIDAVVLAVGSAPVMPGIPGIDSDKAISCTKALLEKTDVGNKVVVVGGGLVGCEMAIEYAQEGKEVTVVEALDSILAAGAPVPIMNSMMIRDLFAKYNISVLTGNRIEAVTEKGALIKAAEGAEQEIDADTVVMAVGFKPLASMKQQLFGNGFEIYEIGDGHAVGSVMTAVWDAYEVARLI